MIELRNMRHLLAVARHPTMHAAATSLFLTQPALTKSIARFEEELGAPLFDRRGRRLVLTELGERMVERAEHLLREVRLIEEDVELWRDIGTGEVAIGVGPLAQLALLPGVLTRFVAAHPNIRVSVVSGHTGSLLPALDNGDVHFVATDYELAVDRSDLEVTALRRDSVAAAVRCGHPLANRRRLMPQALLAYPIASASMPPRFMEWSESLAQGSGHPALLPGIICDNYEALARVATSTDCVIFGPVGLLREYVHRRQLKLLKVDLGSPHTQPSLIRRRGRTLSPAANALFTTFVAEG